MARELYSFFRRKLRKGNGVWWALAYTFRQWQWLRVLKHPKRYQAWLEQNEGPDHE